MLTAPTLSQAASALPDAMNFLHGAALSFSLLQVGPHICVFKTHVDVFDTWSDELAAKLRALADKHGEAGLLVDAETLSAGQGAPLPARPERIHAWPLGPRHSI